MKRSTERILTTHVGSLARPTDLLDTMKEKENGRPYDADLFARQVHDAVADRVQHQVDAGIDIVTDGEMSKSSFLGYVKDRLGGFVLDMGEPSMAPSWQKEVDDFPEYYADYFKKYSSAVTPLRRIICTGPDQLCRPGAAPDRHREPEGGRGRAPRRGGLHAVYRAERVRLERLLRLLRRVPAPCGRGHARGVPGHRRGRVRAPGGRPLADRHAQRSDQGAGRAGASRHACTWRR